MIGLATMVYEPLYHSETGNNLYNIVSFVFYKIKLVRFIDILLLFLVQKNIPLVFVGYEMIIANWYPAHLVGYLPSHIQRALVQ